MGPASSYTGSLALPVDPHPLLLMTLPPTLPAVSPLQGQTRVGGGAYNTHGIESGVV
jgi:hypothetical protein